MITVICIIEQKDKRPLDKTDSYFTAMIVLIVYGVVSLSHNYFEFRSAQDPIVERRAFLALQLIRLVLMIVIFALTLASIKDHRMFGLMLIINLIFYALSTLTTLTRFLYQCIDKKTETDDPARQLNFTK